MIHGPTRQTWPARVTAGGAPAHLAAISPSATRVVPSPTRKPIAFLGEFGLGGVVVGDLAGVAHRVTDLARRVHQLIDHLPGDGPPAGA